MFSDVNSKCPPLREMKAHFPLSSLFRILSFAHKLGVGEEGVTQVPDAVWRLALKKDADKVEQIQRRATRMKRGLETKP